MEAVREYLRPGNPEAVDILESGATGVELRVQIRSYTDGEDTESEDDSAKREVTKHLFSRLRGKPNLVFAGSRQNVEWYADALREMSEKAKVPVDFLPHHANLSVSTEPSWRGASRPGAQPPPYARPPWNLESI